MDPMCDKTESSMTLLSNPSSQGVYTVRISSEALCLRFRGDLWQARQMNPPSGNSKLAEKLYVDQ